MRGSNGRANKIDDATITKSTGNVFRDLGLANADELLAKAELSILLECIIQERGLTQRGAAKLFGVAPSDVSDLVRGKLGRFSYERLIRLLLRAGADVEVRVARARANGAHGKLVVRSP